jgi:hypothetical protein
VALKGSNMGNTVHRLVRPVVSALLLGVPALLLALAAPACVDNNVTLFIRQVQVREADSGCVAVADPAGLHVSVGVFDTDYSSEFWGALLVGNQLAARGQSDTLRPESNRVQLYEADVEIFDSGGGTMSSFSMPISGFVDVGSPTDPAYGIANVALIDAGSAGALAGQQTTVIVRVKVYGETLGGIEVETGYWDFPIQVCAGCTPCTCPKSIDDDFATWCNPGLSDTIDCRRQACWGANMCGCNITV